MQYHYQSNPMRIGKYEWRVVVRNGTYSPRVTDYEFRTPECPEYHQPAGRFKSMTEWPRYNHNDGTYAGCPKTLRKLYDQNIEAINASLLS